jgi:predicted nucleic acid-binding protein
LIIDTDVLVWFYRGKEIAKKILYANMPFSISSVTYIELLQGARNKDELKTLAKDVKQWSTSILQINESISEHAIILIEKYALSHGLELADSLIASSAIACRETLLTGNFKHYSYIPNLQIIPFHLGG